MLISRSCYFIGKLYDTIHVDLFNSIYQKSNEEKINKRVYS